MIQWISKFGPIIFGLAVMLAVWSDILPFVSIEQDVTLFSLGFWIIMLGVLRLATIPDCPDYLVKFAWNLTSYLKIGLRKLAFKIEGNNNRWHANH